MTRPEAPTRPAVLVEPAPAFSMDEASEIARRRFAITASATPLVSERDQNFRLDAGGGEAYVLKIRPSLVFSREDAVLLVERLDDALASV